MRRWLGVRATTENATTEGVGPVRSRPRRSSRLAAAMSVLCSVTVLSTLGSAPHIALAALQTDIVGPAGSGAFGEHVLVLTNGNFVVVDSKFDSGALADVGAVALYNGATNQLISRLTGAAAGDAVGAGGVVEVGNSNFVVASRYVNAAAGAATWVSGTAGLNGVVSAANSLIGSHPGDDVTAGGITVLTNGNYVFTGANWRNSANTPVGAATWGNGNAPLSGVVSATNSLVGTTSGDGVGLDVTALTNGNYVVISYAWKNGGVSVGAVTWANGNLSGPRTVGPVTTSNSLYGGRANDSVGLGVPGVSALSNGNYVVSSFYWDLTATVTDVGAITWGNGAAIGPRTTGPVSTANSLVGTTTSDLVGLGGVVTLGNANYVVGTPFWDNGATKDVGAATLLHGNAATSATITGSSGFAGSSLIGDVANDHVGGRIVALLGSAAAGEYVVASPGWHGALGAATWGSASGSGTVGVVSAANSVVGSTAGDAVSSGGLTPLTNGNYVVASPAWQGGDASGHGAATLGLRGAPVIGAISANNSMVGQHPTDHVSSGGVVALATGGAVVVSPQFDNSRGAVTWGSGNGALGLPTPFVTSANSLVGVGFGDRIGEQGVVALTNGNYVVLSSNWSDSINTGARAAGAATWADGSVGIRGTISAGNSLIGPAFASSVGSSATPLPDGTYVVLSDSYRSGNNTISAATVGLVGGTRGVPTATNTVFGPVIADFTAVSTKFTANGSIALSRAGRNLVTLLTPDLTPPAFPATPPDVTAVSSPGAATAPVSYSQPVAVDDVGTPAVTCTPPSGSSFPVGSTVVTCTATNASGLTATTSFTVIVTAGRDYVPLAPARLADTRANGSTVDGLFVGGGPMAAGSTLELTVAGRGGVPADAVAVTLNVTVTDPQAAGYLTVYPCGSAQPTASNLNYATGTTIPNAVVSKVGTGGTVCVFAQQPLHLVVDVNGAFPPTTTYSAINPARVLDTRSAGATVDALQQGTGPVAAGSVTTVQLTGRAGVPADATAAVLNVTVTEPASAGYATVYPCGSEPPTASNLNYTTGLTIPDLVIAKLGTGGSVCIFTQAATHLIVDALGYFPAGTTYSALLPARLLDTRSASATIDGIGVGAGAAPAGAVTIVHVRDRGGVPAGATTSVLNVTVTEPAAAGYVTVYPCGIDPPLASNLNFVAGQTIPNAVISQIGATGDVCLFNSQPTHLIVDVTGYFP